MSDSNERNEAIIKEFRVNDGKVGGHFVDSTLLLLHTTGAKSGLPRINPLVYLADGERLAESIGAIPSSFHAHPKLAKLMERRQKSVADGEPITLYGQFATGSSQLLVSDIELAEAESRD